MMDRYAQAVKDLYENRGQRAVEMLQKNRMAAFCVSSCAEAKEAMLAYIPAEAFVVAGDSLTVRQVGLLEALAERKQNLIDPFSVGGEDYSIMREAFSADIFITGANAVTLDGKIVSVDSIGNRVAPMIYGPKHVLVVVGANKIVADEAEAVKRIEDFAAPANAKRLHKKTPCTTSGFCSDCESAERICNTKVVLNKKPRFTDVSVFIITEGLGL